MNIMNLVIQISDIVWGPVLIVFLVGTGIYLTIRLKFIQVRKFKHAFEIIAGKHDKPHSPGEITHFQALSAALSATIGIGNIAGVATAIALGGPGAVFWMWVTALFGMATKFTSCLLSLKFRKIHPDGSISGGPMYYLEHGLKSKPLAVIFAVCTIIATFGIGNMVQSNSVADALSTSLSVPPLVTGIILAVIVWLVIIGGIKRIGKVAGILTPFMVFIYCSSAMIIIIANITLIPSLLITIVKSAFTGSAAAGGFAGSTILYTMRMGVARGIFSNESGLGSAPIVYAAAKTDDPVKEGLVAMVGPFIDTIVVCTMTALVILLSGLWQTGLTGAGLSAKAFDACLPIRGDLIVSLGIVLFAVSTVISWSYYGDRSIEYLFGKKIIVPYRWFYCFLILVGAVVRLKLVWAFADIANAFMAVPNIIGIIGLSGLVVSLTKEYTGRNRR